VEKALVQLNAGTFDPALKGVNVERGERLAEIVIRHHLEEMLPW
jgi:hypothetical protein